MEVLCSDKTGTLTLNRLSLDPADILPWGGATPEHVLLMASLSANWTAQQVRSAALKPFKSSWGGIVRLGQGRAPV
jgi:H+-transporting ATPase